MQISHRTKRFLNRFSLVAVVSILIMAATGLVSASEGRATVVQPSTRAVTVQKFNDLNGNGVRDNGEALLSGWQMTVKQNGNTVAQGNTGDNGTGTVIFNLAAGTYQICETLQAGWENPSDPDLCKDVTVAAGVDPVAGPNSVTVSFIDGSRTNSYFIEFVSLVGRTWTYRVTEVSGRDLSHWTLGSASCVTPNTNRVTASSPTAELGKDGTRPFWGIKWNTADSFSTGLFSFTLDADYPIGTVQVQAKAGSGGPNGDGTAYSTIAGPVCDAPAAIPPVLFGNRQLPQTGSITIYKQVNDEAYDRQFAFTYIRGTNTPQTFYLSDTHLNTPQQETELFGNLPAGTYTFSENLPLPTGWSLVGFGCSTEASPENVPGNIVQIMPLQSGNGFSVALAAGQNLFCSFGNSYTPPPDVRLNLTAECAVGDLRYWRVTGDDQTNDVNFTWDGPGSNDGSGQVHANARYYFTTVNAGGANTTILRWFNPSTNNNQQVNKAHNNTPCVYHVTFVKTWTGVDQSPVQNGTILTAESSIATATCGYTNGVWSCQYNRKSDNASIADLEVPFGETYSVTETGVAGWGAVAGVGTGFEGIEGFDTSALPNALVYDVSDERYCETTMPQQFNPPLAKFCTHEVVNERQQQLGSIQIFKYEDVNGNGQFDEGEEGLSGWEFTLDGDATQTTDEDGNATFENISVGEHEICENVIDGWENTDPGEDGCETVTVVSGQTAYVDFGNHQNEEVDVFKFNDLNGNGIQDEGETGLQGWEFTVYDANEDFVDSGVTNANGFVSFELPIGTYFVCETDSRLDNGAWVNTLPGYTTTIDGNPCREIVIGGDGGSVVQPGPYSVVVSFDDNQGTNSYLIEFLGVDTDTNTWTYHVTEQDGKDLSHWSIGMETCENHIVDGSFDPSGADLGDDPSTDGTFIGIKWDVTEGFTSGEFSFQLDGNYPIGTVGVLVKAGNDGPNDDGSQTGEIAGPDCNEEAPEDVVLYFGNQQQQGTLTIRKVAGLAGNFAFTGDLGNFNLASNTQDSFPVDEGTFTVTETALPGWTLANVTCDTDAYELTMLGVVVSVPAGGDVTCTFANRPNSASVTIVKQVEPETSDASFGFNNAAFSLGDGESEPFTNLTPGVAYTYTEDAANGFTLASIDCGQTNSDTVNLAQRSVTITPAPGENVTCTFTNTQNTGTITISKVLEGEEGEGGEASDSTMNFAQNNPLYTFRISRNGGLGDAVVPMSDANVAMDDEFPIEFSLEAGQTSIPYALEANTYIIEEFDIPEGFHLEDIDCGEGVDFMVEIENNQVILTVNADDDIECTFTNAPNDGTITISKVLEGEEGEGGEQEADSAMNFAQNNPLYTFRISRNGGLGDAVVPMSDASVAMDDEFPIEFSLEAGQTSIPYALAPDSYIVEEIEIPQGFHLEDIDCGEGVEFSLDLENNQIIITINSGDDIHCTFTNAPNDGTITITKEVVGQEGGEEAISDPTMNFAQNNPLYTFRISRNGGLGDAVIYDNPMVQAAQEAMDPVFPIEISLEAGQSQAVDLAPDSYIIKEIEIPDGFHLEDIDCGEGVEFSLDLENNQIIITINSDDDIECTFTNAGDTGSITVNKVVEWGNVTPTEQTFNICVDGPIIVCQELVTTNGGELVFNDLPVGAYTVTEPNVDTALWTYTGANVTLVGHEDAEEVTVTNSRTAPLNGTLIIRKESDVAGTFNFTSGSEGINPNFSLITVEDGDNFSAQTSFSLPAGSYDVSETIPTDWLLIDRTCTSSNDQVISEPFDDNGVMVTLASGETVTCVFTNDYQEPPVPGSLTVIKSVNWSNASIDTAATFTINVTGPGGYNEQLVFDFDGGTETLTGLTPGQYTVTEVNPGVKWTVSYSPSQTVTVSSGANGGAEVTVTNTHVRITTCEGFDYAMYAEMYLTGQITVNGNTATGRITNNGTQDCAILVGLVSYSMFDRVIDNQIIFDYDPLTPASPSNPFTVIPPNGGSVTFTVDLPVNCAAQVDLFYGPLLPSLSGQRYGTRLLAWTQLLNRPFCQRPGTLILRKDADAAGEFTFNIPGYGNVNLTTTDNDLSDAQQISLNPGSYSITEAAQDNWVLSTAVCDNVAINNGGTFNIVSNTTVTCVFTNDFQEPEVTEVPELPTQPEPETIPVEPLPIITPVNEPPVADAGVEQTLADTDGLDTEMVTLDGSLSSDADGQIVLYTWSENGIVIASGSTPTLPVTLSSGTHILTLVVTDDDGATSAEAFVTITIAAPEVPAPEVTPETTPESSAP